MGLRHILYVVLILSTTLSSSPVYAVYSECQDAFVRGTMEEFTSCENYYRTMEQTNETIKRAEECQRKQQWCLDYPDDTIRCPPSC